MRFICVAIFMVLSILSVSAQSNVNVSGNVVNAGGKPSDFITVLLKNTTFGTTTNAEGKFSFTALAGEYTLVILRTV